MQIIKIGVGVGAMLAGSWLATTHIHSINIVVLDCVAYALHGMALEHVVHTIKSQIHANRTTHNVGGSNANHDSGNTHNVGEIS